MEESYINSLGIHKNIDNMMMMTSNNNMLIKFEIILNYNSIEINHSIRKLHDLSTKLYRPVL